MEKPGKEKQTQEQQRKEEQRASNIIWNASENYSFKPEILAYDENGKADLYWNYIIGAVHKYYNYSQLQSFFNYLKDDMNYAFYENLMWIGLENCTYKKGKNERLVLEDLRRSYSKKVISKVIPATDYDLVDEIKMAHFQRALGEEPKMADDVFTILNELEFDESMNTEQIIFKMNEIINVYLDFNPAHHERNWFQVKGILRKKISFKQKEILSYHQPFFEKLRFRICHTFRGSKF